jgi:septum formation protein
LVERLASAKGRASARKVAGDSVSYVVIGADTAVVLDDQVLGKPDSPEEAERMLRRLRGRDHEVLTAVFLLRTDRGTSTCDVERTRVRFRDYDDETIRAYVESGEPMDKAGAYGIQGGGGRLVESVEGSRNNVIGLPVERLDGWLARIGIDMRRLAQRAAD